ncbi:hypothetical protein [Streptomyces sp. NPDC006477]|uniref:hypothetical protein n=1 Tax=Streptomyces sp. NPDC006477 TaxID=3364747 RepID=UPI0036C3A8D5
MSALPKRGWSQFSIAEWHRLSAVATRHEPSLRLAYTKAAQTNVGASEDAIRHAVTLLLAEVCDSTANIYGMVFNPGSQIYADTVDRLVEQFVGSVNPPNARREVERLVPSSLGLVERASRVDTYGLDARSAVRIERMRQNGVSSWEVEAERQRSILVRGNMIATTETNRVVNYSLIALWRDNMESSIEKARRRRPKVEYIGTSRRRIQEAPNKTWMTRRDEKVCKYCDPLDGITARLDAEFDTRYGIFEAPPIHPNCRCFMVLG